MHWSSVLELCIGTLHQSSLYWSSALELSVLELSVLELSVLELSISELSVLELYILELSLLELSISELSALELSVLELSVLELYFGAHCIGALYVRDLCIGVLCQSSMYWSYILELSVSKLSCVFQEHSSIELGSRVHHAESPQSSERHADSLDQYHYGWPTGPEVLAWLPVDVVMLLDCHVSAFAAGGCLCSVGSDFLIPCIKLSNYGQFCTLRWKSDSITF